MDTVKDVFKRELRKKFVAKTFASDLFGSDSEEAKRYVSDFETIYILASALYPNEQFFGGNYND